MSRAFDIEKICGDRSESLITQDPLKYTPNLILVSVPTPSGKVIFCYDKSELVQQLSPEAMLIEDSPIERKKVEDEKKLGRRVYLNVEETKLVENWRSERRRNIKKGIWKLPFGGIYVDYSFIDCLNRKKNSIDLEVDEKKMVFKSLSVSGFHHEIVTVFKAKAIPRCEMLSFIKGLNLENCDETSTFEEGNKDGEEKIIETIESQEENKKMLELVAQQQKRNLDILRNRRRNQVLTTNFENYVERTKYDENGNPTLIERFKKNFAFVGQEHEQFYYYSDEKTPSVESYGFEKILKWFNDSGKLHRDNDLPALIVYINNILSTEQWYQNGVMTRSLDLPTIVMYHDDGITVKKQIRYEDGRLKYEKEYYENNVPACNVVNVGNEGYRIEGRDKNGKLSYKKMGAEAVIYDAKENPVTMIQKTNNSLVFSTDYGDFMKTVSMNSINSCNIVFHKEGYVLLEIALAGNRMELTSFYKPVNDSGRGSIRVQKSFLINEFTNSSIDFSLDDSRNEIEGKQKAYSDHILNSAVKVFADGDEYPTEYVNYTHGSLYKSPDFPTIVFTNGDFVYNIYEPVKSVHLHYDEEEDKNKNEETEYGFGVIQPDHSVKVIDGDIKAMNHFDEIKARLETMHVDFNEVFNRDRLDTNFIHSELKFARLCFTMLVQWKTLLIAHHLKNFEERSNQTLAFSDTILDNYSEYDRDLYYDD